MTEQYPVIYEVDYRNQGRASLDNISDAQKHELLLDFPTVYIIGAQSPKQDLLIYVGETTSIQRWTLQLLDDDPQLVEMVK